MAQQYMILLQRSQIQFPEATAVCTCVLQGSDTLLWPPRGPAKHRLHKHMLANIHNIQFKSFEQTNSIEIKSKIMEPLIRVQSTCFILKSKLILCTFSEVQVGVYENTKEPKEGH